MKLIINSLKSKEESLAVYGHLIFDAKVFAGSFHSIGFSHTRRHGNFITHNFARHANYVTGFMVWMENVLPHLLYVFSSGFGYCLMKVQSYF